MCVCQLSQVISRQYSSRPTLMYNRIRNHKALLFYRELFYRRLCMGWGRRVLLRKSLLWNSQSWWEYLRKNAKLKSKGGNGSKKSYVLASLGSLKLDKSWKWGIFVTDWTDCFVQSEVSHALWLQWGGSLTARKNIWVVTKRLGLQIQYSLYLTAYKWQKIV